MAGGSAFQEGARRVPPAPPDWVLASPRFSPRLAAALALALAAPPMFKRNPGRFSSTPYRPIISDKASKLWFEPFLFHFFALNIFCA